MYSRSPLPLLALVLAAACAPQGGFPSLAPRAVERLSNDEPVRTPAFVPPDASLSARVAQLVSQAREGQGSFEAALPATRALVSRAGGAASESWIEAQQALSRLEAARGPTMRALAELDHLVIARSQGPANTEQLQSLLSAVERVGSLAAEQQNEIDRLRRAL